MAAEAWESATAMLRRGAGVCDAERWFDVTRRIEHPSRNRSASREAEEADPASVGGAEHITVAKGMDSD